MAGSTRQEWLNQNAYRAFPFEEDSDFSCSGGKTLPSSVVLDARVCMFGDRNSDVFLKSASVSEDGSVRLVLEAFDRDVHVSSERFIESDGEMSIRITYGDRESMSRLHGEYVLLSPARMLRSRVLSVPYGIGVDTLSCGGTTSVGTVKTVDGHNTELDVYGNALRLKVLRGAGKGQICPDLRNEICHGRVLYYLNGQKSDSDGSIWIKGDDGVSVSSGTYKGIPAVFIKTSATIDSFMYR